MSIGFEDDKIFLLSVEERKKYRSEIPVLPRWWWLRSPGGGRYCAAFVHSDGPVHYCGDFVNRDRGAVRPALKYDGLRFSESKIPVCFIFGGVVWKIIDEKNQIAIAGMPLWYGRFDTESNYYEKSEVRQKLLQWLEAAEE